MTKSDVLGPSGILLPENEKKIVIHIKKLQKSGLVVVLSVFYFYFEGVNG